MLIYTLSARSFLRQVQSQVPGARLRPKAGLCDDDMGA
jgi:hypothetical protein